jgi:hypothetical protein
VSKDGNSVCDNKTGLWWQQSPSKTPFFFLDAIRECENLTLGGKTWRLPTVEEFQWNSLIDYSVPLQAEALNTPNGPFQDVLSDTYWSATEVAGNPNNRQWGVNFFTGSVDSGLKTGVPDNFHAWFVNDGKKKHGH